MKKICTIILILFTTVFVSCSSQKAVVTSQSNEAYKADSIEYYLTEFEVRQKDYLEKLTGTWNITSMQRQARVPQEALSDVSLVLNNDKSFKANTSCGSISGTYSLKGTSIKFQNINHSTDCTSEQVNELVRLLQNTVSAYTVDNGSLWLRDGSTNIIFRATR